MPHLNDDAVNDYREDALAGLLAEYAPEMAKVAAERCGGGFVDPESCDWYHSVWPYLRCLGVVSSPAWHRTFYNKALRQELERGAGPRVLISGTADFSMAEQVCFSACAARPDPEAVRVTVLDRCPTPLAACRWYAERAGFGLTAVQADISALDAIGGPFDVVTTDAFLTRFDREGCAEVLDAWRALLRAGGSVVTTVRVHNQKDSLRGAADDVYEFVDRVEKRAFIDESGIFHDVQAIVEAAQSYATRMRSTDLGGAQEIVRLLINGGFEVTVRERAQVAGELHPVEYLRIAARKR
jgi:hypothetical protein